MTGIRVWWTNAREKKKKKRKRVDERKGKE